MAEFVTGDLLNDAVIKIIEAAEKKLLIVSPFIRLHDRVCDALLGKKKHHKLKIQILYGKNESKKQDSLTQKDFEFLKDFPNIMIKYEPKLHAKYFSNGNDTLITSMNLMHQSQNNNIEAGVFVKASKVTSLINRFDLKADKYFNDVFEMATTHFSKSPQYRFNKAGIRIKYLNSITETDIITNETRNESLVTGFCIRTGKKIPFNLSRPYSYDAYNNWKFVNSQNYLHPESYCHFSGKPSNGKTTFAKPILYEYYAQAIEIFGVSEKRVAQKTKSN